MESMIMTNKGRLRSLYSKNSKHRNLNRNHIGVRNNRSFKTSGFHRRNININNRNICATNNNATETSLQYGLLMNKTKLAREVHDVLCGRLNDVARIPGDTVQALFNDMQLYPSNTQVREMLQCARNCSRRNSGQYLTFGEFCVFAGELRRGKGKHHNQIQKSTKTLNQCEVFLGGSCNPTTWRKDIAIPKLTKLGISFYNPQVSTWGPELMAAEHDAKESASVLLFVIDSQTRCVAGMIEVAHLVAKKRCLVLVLHPFMLGQSVMNETLPTQEFVDLSEGQSTLLALVQNQGVTVHSNLTSALQCTAHLLRGNTTADNTTEQNLTEKLMKLREVFDNLDTKGTGELSLNDVCQAYYVLTNNTLRISDLYSIMDMSDHSNPDNVRINFEQFCGIVAEFSTSGCLTPKIDDWVNQPLQRQMSANNNSNYEYNMLNGQKINQQNGESFVQNGDNHYYTYDIYLGGSCTKRTTWRQNIAVPILKKYGLTYYNPSLHENCSLGFRNVYLNGDRISQDFNDNSSLDCARNKSRDLLNEFKIMEDSKILLFVISNETRSISSMILAAHFIALKKNVVLCIQQLPLEDCIIGSDVLTKQAIKDYNRARAYLSDIAVHEKVPLYESVADAVQYAINISRQR